MKKLILLLVAVAMCVLFTACPNKPDEAVVIPDGLYEETAHFVRHNVLDWGNLKEESLAIDTVYVMQVLIDQGEFVYQGLCSDTFHVGNWDLKPGVRYVSPFIYSSNYYCPEYKYENGAFHFDSDVKNPAHMSSDGFVIIPAPQFEKFLWATMKVDTNYVYRAPVSEDGGIFYFEQNHEFVARGNGVLSYKYHIEHTLRRL